MGTDKIAVLYVEENQNGIVGGSHYCLLDLIRELNKDKFRPYVMFYEDNRITDDFKRSGAEVFVYHRPNPLNLIRKFQKMRLGTRYRIYYYPLKSMQIIINFITRDLIPLSYFIFFLIRNNIKIVHMNNTVFTGLIWIVACRVTGKKIIVHQRTQISSIPWYLLYHYRWFDYILGVSDYMREYLKKYGIYVSRYSTIYDRVNVEDYRKRVTKNPQQIRDEFSVKADQPIIGIIGNLQRWKGQMTVIEAVNLLHDKYPNMKCLLVGDSSNRNEDDIRYFKELTDKIMSYNLNNNIIITGYRNDIPDVLNAMDIFIHASIEPEPFGMVVLEAMGMGKAVIASNEGGPVEIIENNVSGILIEPGNPCLLAGKMDLLLSNKPLQNTMGQSARQRVENKFSRLDMQFIEGLYLRLAQS
jgi:glycosyltransferase involved in cell wall biosynthesis